MSKLNRGFTLFEILIVIAIVGFIYGLVFLPLAAKFDKENVEYTGILSLTKRYNDSKSLLQNIDMPLYLRCDKKYQNCAFYDTSAKVVGKAFALSVQAPKAVYRLASDGTFYAIWQDSSQDGFSFLCPDGMPQLFIEDDKFYKIGPIAQNNFVSDSKEEAIRLSLQYLPITKEAVVEK